MRISRLMAVAAIGCAISGAAAIPALAGPNHSAHPAGTHGTLDSSISPHTAHNGTRITMHASGAHKKTDYICLFALVKGSQHGQNLNNSTSVTSSKKGKFSCSLTFHPFHATVAGKVRHCPLTKADKKAHIVCGFAAADPSDPNGSNAFWPIKAKK